MGNLYGSEYWTYLLPRRVGEAKAREITQRRLPMGAKEAVAIGLADARFGARPGAFLKAAIARAAGAWRSDPGWPAHARGKRAQREPTRPPSRWQRYRDEELARMQLNFYGFDPSYHVARYHFVYKMPKARTPGYLARHRVRPGVPSSAHLP